MLIQDNNSILMAEAENGANAYCKVTCAEAGRSLDWPEEKKSQILSLTLKNWRESVSSEAANGELPKSDGWCLSCPDHVGTRKHMVGHHSHPSWA